MQSTTLWCRRACAAFACAAMFCGVPARVADASYILTPTVGGSSQATILYGQTFTLDLMLHGDPGDAHNSSLFRLLFTASGIEYLGYAWAAPYQNQSIFDFSAPLWSALPAVITPELVPGPNTLADIELSNVVPAGAFGSGVLVSLTLRVPANWSGPDSLFIVPLPDTFANGFSVVPTVAGEALRLDLVVPGPGSGALMAMAIGLCLAPRRRTR